MVVLCGSSVKLRSIDIFSPQIEQEMGLIIGKADVKSHFLQTWTIEYVPAIISYAGTSTKKGISLQLEDLKETG